MPALVADTVIKVKKTVAEPLGFIPVFPGTNSEYDSKALKQEPKVNLVSLSLLDRQPLSESVDSMVDNIDKANIIF